MAGKSLADLSEKMRKIDFCMMSTKTSSGVIANRPMSSNGDTEYDGESYFFSYDNTSKINDIDRDPCVTLAFCEAPSMLGRPGMFISIEGKASLVRDRSMFDDHWVKDLERWFPQGVETPGLLLIKVQADRLKYWDGEDNGVIEA